MGRSAKGVRGIRLSQGDSVVNILAIKDESLIATITEGGFGKITEANKYRLQKRGGKGVLNIKTREKTGFVVKALAVAPDDEIFLINSRGLSITFPASSIRKTGRSASGVKLMKLDDGAKVVDAQVIRKKDDTQFS